MKKKNKTLIYIILFFSFLILAPSAIARFTAMKDFKGAIDVNNHPCNTPPKTIKSMGREFEVKTCPPNFDESAHTNEGMYMTEDDDGESYYYRGLADNWVSFGGYYWRIIRINGDGSIRILYTGTKSKHSGVDGIVGKTVYTTQKIEQNANYRTSKLKEATDNWYRSNIQGKSFASKIADSGFCNDMTRIGQYSFGPGLRVCSKGEPSLKCPEKDRDFLTKANNKLSYPVGAITLDEIAFAGTYRCGFVNEDIYLSLGIYGAFWSLSPTYGGNSCAVGAYSIGASSFSADAERGVRPVINLKSTVTITSGDGTEGNPYIIN